MNRLSERGQPCPHESSPRHSRTRLSALLSFAGSWSRCAILKSWRLSMNPIVLVLVLVLVLVTKRETNRGRGRERRGGRRGSPWKGPAKSCVPLPLRPRMACATDCPGGGSRQPVSGKRPAGAADIVEDTSDQPQVSLRQHQAHWKMAHVARGAFTGAHRPELRRDL